MARLFGRSNTERRSAPRLGLHDYPVGTAPTPERLTPLWHGLCEMFDLWIKRGVKKLTPAGARTVIAWLEANPQLTFDPSDKLRTQAEKLIEMLVSHALERVESGEATPAECERFLKLVEHINELAISPTVTKEEQVAALSAIVPFKR